MIIWLESDSKKRFLKLLSYDLLEELFFILLIWAKKNYK